MVNLATAVGANGLRVFTGANGASVTSTDLANARIRMGKYGITNPTDLVFMVGVEQFNKLVQETTFKTIYTFGPRATIHTGTLGSVWGIPLIMSEYMDDVGPTSDSNNNVALLLYKPGFVVGSRRGVLVEQDYFPATQVMDTYISTRLDMRALTTVASAALSNTYSMAVVVQTGNSVV